MEDSSVIYKDEMNTQILYFSDDIELDYFVGWLLGASDSEKIEDLKLDSSFDVLYNIMDMILKKRRVLSDIRYKGFTIVLEENYIDRVYRDSYYLYYSSKHFSYDRFCIRLSIFEGYLKPQNILNYSEEELQEKFVGNVVIRPLKKGAIGRSLLNPYYFTNDEDVYLKTATYNTTVLGKRLYVEAFPYSMQDGETTSCAEICIINMLDYYSKYAEYRYFLPSDIIKIANENGFERRLPTKGLEYFLLTKVFNEAGFYPRLYQADMINSHEKFKRILHYYIESGIPAAIGLCLPEGGKHSVVCIGHGSISTDYTNAKICIGRVGSNKIYYIDSADLVKSYIVMDDNKSPYSVYEWKEIKNNRPFEKKRFSIGSYYPDAISVPLYRRMHMEAEDAQGIFASILADPQIGFSRFASNDYGSLEQPLVIRIFMASSRNFKSQRIKNFTKEDEEIRGYYLEARLPRFVWVCEIYTEESYKSKRPIGELAIDATSTSDGTVSSLLIANYPSWILVRLPEEYYDDGSFSFDYYESDGKLKSYNSNLEHPLPSA